MAFRGLFDGSVEIGQAREARAHQMQMQQNQLQAQMEMERARLQAQRSSETMRLQASMAESRADRSLKQQQMGMENAVTERKFGLMEREQDLKQQEFDAGASLREMQQQQARLMLEKAQQEFDDDQEQRASLTALRQSAFGAALITSITKGVVPRSVLAEVDKANGVVTGEPGSILEMYGTENGPEYVVVGTDESGNPGKIRQRVDPMQLFAIAQSLYGKDVATQVAQAYRTRDNNATRMGLSADAYMKAMMQEEARAAAKLAAEEAKTDRAVTTEGMKTDRAVKLQEMKILAAKALNTDVAKVTVNGALLEELNNQAAEIENQIAMLQKRKQPVPPDLREKQQETIGALRGARSLLAQVGQGDGADGGAAQPTGQPTGQQAQISRNPDGSFLVRVAGQMATITDTPAHRKLIQERFGVTIPTE